MAMAVLTHPLCPVLTNSMKTVVMFAPGGVCLQKRVPSSASANQGVVAQALFLLKSTPPICFYVPRFITLFFIFARPAISHHAARYRFPDT